MILLYPFLGVFLYFIFGVKMVQEKARTAGKGLSEEEQGKGVTHHIRLQLARDFPQLSSVEATATGMVREEIRQDVPIFLLRTGEDAYPPMLDAIRSARRSVVLSTYILGNDTVGRHFADELKKAQNRGVQVRVLIDAVGERHRGGKISPYLRRLGVPCKIFNIRKTPRANAFGKIALTWPVSHLDP